MRMMAERAAAAEAMFNSLSSEQQGELRALFDQMMQNMELNFSMNRLVSNLRQATPDIDWSRAHRMRGQDGSPFAQAASVAEQLGELKGLEEFLGQSHAAQGLPEVDVEAVRRNLGDDAARHVERLQKALQGLKDQGFIDRQGNRLKLSAKGIRKIGQIALKDIFNQLRDSPTLGGHPVATVARGGDREETTQALGAGRGLFAAPTQDPAQRTAALRDRARRYDCTPMTSKSKSTKRRAARRRSSRSTSRSRWPCGGTWCPRRRWCWR